MNYWSWFREVVYCIILMVSSSIGQRIGNFCHMAFQRDRVEGRSWEPGRATGRSSAQDMKVSWHLLRKNEDSYLIPRTLITCWMIWYESGGIWVTQTKDDFLKQGLDLQDVLHWRWRAPHPLCWGIHKPAGIDILCKPGTVYLRAHPWVSSSALYSGTKGRNLLFSG